ncbi:MAG: hypothetical protein H6Q91_2261 [Deltaproteobacteria bacterium]|nr:hypothetical protein [Deltaproteobacteria bacterium]
MTKSLEHVFAIASRLPESEQEDLAAAILAEIEAEDRFDAALAGSPESLDELADEALAEHRRGKTQPLDPQTR